MINADFWNGKKVFLTGHTGFKGSWLSLWLSSLEAKVTGYALQPITTPNLFELSRLDEIMEKNYIGDIRDLVGLTQAMKESEPEIVIHMAAQPLVRESYVDPMGTYSTNVMGTVNVLEAVRACESVTTVINVTTDKCYENREWVWGYRENDPLGGYDPYSSSKACSELVTKSYRNSFFSDHSKERRVAISSARAGNVIGGGDWAADRLVPDCLRSLLANDIITIRNPYAIRPWQHVLEPLSGYLLLAEKMYEHGPKFADAWNFGPNDADAKPVEWIVKTLCEKWGNSAQVEIDQRPSPHEAKYLKLDCSKAMTELEWRPNWNLESTLQKIVDWTLAYQSGMDMRKVSLEQIADFQG
ncbi:CDP-glucose 4,6-dehydratase [Paenibacillus dendritiformis]|uniref:CDP-glucose 4,6-dehydratase n=1 Tax=Paenibacillus dendritiformis TaxID=130049 RepID=UPI00248C3CA1|nr:CDP-glucose 4,6-dehydratase [Paenibacillus dendritiformis]WGU93818.1 CDP-glucose 4,6-dehydratase [Paenibacillus dendritiformis]